MQDLREIKWRNRKLKRKGKSVEENLKERFMKTANERYHVIRYQPPVEGKQLKVGQSLEDVRMKIKLVGTFTDFELKMIARTLRKIEQRHPEREYMMLLETPDLSVEEAKDLITRIYKSTIKGNDDERGKREKISDV